jgi:hypothetical protein
MSFSASELLRTCITNIKGDIYETILWFSIVVWNIVPYMRTCITYITPSNPELLSFWAYEQGCQNWEFTLNQKRIVRSKNRKLQPKLVDSTLIILLIRKGKSRSHNRKSQSKLMDSTHNSIYIYIYIYSCM